MIIITRICSDKTYISDRIYNIVNDSDIQVPCGQYVVCKFIVRKGLTGEIKDSIYIVYKCIYSVLRLYYMDIMQ